MSTPANTQEVDFQCPDCRQRFQLKAKSSPYGNRVLDGAYAAMLAALASDKAPNLCLMHYDLAEWRAKSLIVIPHFAFPPSSILARSPLSANARRAGWVGCFIQLTNIPNDAKIDMIRDGVITPPREVRQQFARLRPLQNLTLGERGWTLDVLNEIRSLGKVDFTNADIYERVPKLSELHPTNKHVRDKIRQQLQFLRDRGFVVHLGSKRWRLTQPSSQAS